ncbi:MAG: LptF/LptG family permease [Treponema sp.]|jgi:lipopolysaccharide export system permease protein|nr:LptF/LptG family permease [Treponema sp.]
MIKARYVLDRYLLRQFYPIFFVAISMFVFILLLLDLFSNLVRYLNNDVPVLTMLKISFFFIPRSISYAMPLSLLFASAYTLGDLYSRNELTTVFASGIPFWRFSFSLFIVGLIASIFSFYLDDIVVIPTLKIKSELSKIALHQVVVSSDYDIVIKTRNDRRVYMVDYIDYDNRMLNGIFILERNESGKYVSQIRASSAAWNGNYWEFENAVIYQYENGILRIKPMPYDTSYIEPPDMFMRNAVNVKELPAKQAGLLVNDLRISGLSYYEAQADYYHRYSFSTTSFIVMILSVSMGGRFKKNILLMSLFTSLSIAVVYYISEMLSMAMAGLNYIPPIIGAWFPVVLFIFIGIFLIRSAKT